MKKIFKYTLIGSASIGLAIATAVPLALINIPKTDDGFINLSPELSVLKNKIVNGSSTTGSEKYYRYDNLIFNSNESLKNYVYNKGDLQSYMTSTNPASIKKDHNILDPDKIESLDIKNFRKVYKNANNHVVKTEQEALNSYINPLNLIDEYSYDGEEWYRDSNLARINAKQKKEINKSLYYYFDNQYYNAFNIDDINSLLLKMENGYFAHYDKTLDGSPSAESKPIFGNRLLFHNQNQRELIKDFQTSFYNEVVEFKGDSILTLKFGDKIIASIDGRILGSSFDLKFSKQYPSADAMRLDFLDPTKWEYEEEEWKTTEDKKIVTKKVKTIAKRKIEVPHETGFKVQTITIKNIKTDTNTKGDIVRYPINLYGNEHITEFNGKKSKGILTLYANPDKKEILRQTLEPVQGFDNSLTNDLAREWFDVWYMNYFNNVMTDFGNEGMNSVPNWDNYKYGDFIENKSPYLKLGKIYKDKLYRANGNRGNQLSLINSYFEWQEMKPRILASGDAENDEYQLSTVKNVPGALTVSRDDLDNFLWLQDFDARIMYSVSSKKHASDRKGILLANTEVQAKELHALFSDKSLKTRYRVIDKAGNELEPYYGSEKEVIKQIHEKIKLTAKYVSIKELNSFPEGKEIEWSSLQKRGQYTIYSIPNPNKTSQKNARIWYETKEAAYEALTVNLKVDSNLETLLNNYYIYNYVTKKGVTLPIRYKEEDLDDVVEKILEYEKEVGNKYED